MHYWKHVKRKLYDAVASFQIISVTLCMFSLPPSAQNPGNGLVGAAITIIRSEDDNSACSETPTSVHPSLAPLRHCCETMERCMYSWSFYHISILSFAGDGIANRERLNEQLSQLGSTSFSFSSRGRMVCMACLSSDGVREWQRLLSGQPAHGMLSWDSSAKKVRLSWTSSHRDMQVQFS